MRARDLCLLLAVASQLTACAYTNVEMREKTTRFAERNGFKPLQLPAAPYTIMGFEHMTDPNAPVRVFIEGDGKSWLTREMPSPDPTPYTPTALFLAANDNSPNVGWIARPCQYYSSDICTVPVWTDQQYSETNIAAMNAALDHWKGRKLELVGYSGGANIALLLAARRNDITAIYTVAGNTDPDAFTAFHGVTPPPAGSLNAVKFADKTAMIPQIHFVGEKDRTVPPKLAQDYQAKLPANNCSKVITVPEASHMDGWTERWARLKDRLLPCTQPKAYYQ